MQCTGWVTALTPLYFKTVFSEGSAFRNTKIIYSLWNNPFEGTLDERMVEKLIADGIPADDLKVLAEGGTPVDWIKLNKLAIDYADAITVSTADVPAELIEYAKASGKPVMDYPGDDNYQAYIDFYKSL